MERRLFPNGGYYLDNGATLCGSCHIAAEQTIISVEEICVACNISRNPLPPHLYPDQKYDKWGNAILPNGTRLAGELSDDPSVRKVLSSVSTSFISRVKYPRTYHLPFSPGVTSDDRILDSYAGFEGQEVIVTEKMDGENTTWYKDYCHARSIDYESHPSRDRIKAMWAEVAHDIPDGFRICGENLYAKHSIGYNELTSYFQMFSIWDGLNCLSWDETVQWSALLGLSMVPVLYVGLWNEATIRSLATNLDLTTQEGLVVRVSSSFHYKHFRNKVAKYVRKNHVQTHGHWMRQHVIPNRCLPQN